MREFALSPSTPALHDSSSRTCGYLRCWDFLALPATVVGAPYFCLGPPARKFQSEPLGPRNLQLCQALKVGRRLLRLRPENSVETVQGNRETIYPVPPVYCQQLDFRLLASRIEGLNVCGVKPLNSGDVKAARETVPASLPSCTDHTPCVSQDARYKQQ